MMKKQFISAGLLQIPCKCLYFKKINGYYVPCGKCSWCRENLARDWSIRCKEHAKYRHVYNALLTYDDVHLPYHNDAPSLNYTHVQGFLKRFRYHVEKNFKTKLSFFCVGEYGGRTHRPHYHLLVFSDSPLTTRISYGEDPLHLIQDIIDIVWKYGFADIECFNEVKDKKGKIVKDVSSLVYYMVAYLVAPSDGREYDKFNRPFRRMSLRPSIGADFLEREIEYINSMFKKKQFVYKNKCHDGTYTVNLPRYYKRKIVSDELQKKLSLNYMNDCIDFDYYLINNGLTRKQYFEQLKKLQEDEKRKSKRKYTERKVHETNGRLAARVLSRKKRG